MLNTHVSYTISFPLILLGDFNMPGIDWEHYNTPVINKKEILFLEYIQSLGLTQKINQPTRGQNILIYYCSDENLISDIEINPPLRN